MEKAFDREALQETIRSRKTEYGKFLMDTENDIVLSLHEELLFDRDEMKNISLFDATYSEIGCRLSVRLYNRGTEMYEIKKGDYNSFRPWLRNYYGFMSCLDIQTRTSVLYCRSTGWAIPYEKLSQAELNRLMENYQVCIFNTAKQKWYIAGSLDVEKMQKQLNLFDV